MQTLILVGAGHSNLIAIKKLALSLSPDIQMILISDVAEAPYSGMVPGYLAGHYAEEEIVFDLEKLSNNHHFKLIKDQVISIDTAANIIKLASGETLSYDCLSINVGIQPQKIENQGQLDEHLIYIKPLSHLLPKWKKIIERKQRNLTFAVVGAGSAGCEVAAAINLRGMGLVTLFTRGATILPELNASARNKIKNKLSKLGIQVRTNSNINSYDVNKLLLDNGETFQFDYIFVTTGARANTIPGDLDYDDKGFIITNKYLRLKNRENVFASGDCISFSHKSLPKAGVFAVAQGPILALNILAYFNSLPMTEYKPQTQFLKILLVGEKVAFATRGNLSWMGALSWKLKKYLDQTFMRKYK